MEGLQLPKFNKTKGESEKAPERWMNRYNLSGKLKVHYREIQALSDIYQKNNPEYFKEHCKKYKDENINTRDYYSPEFIQIIERELEKNRTPGGWKSIRNLARELKIHPRVIQEIING